MSTDEISSLDLYIKAASEKKALNMIVLDVRDLTSIADVFIICSGRSNRQVNAIADSIVAKLKKHKIKPLSVEEPEWGTGFYWITVMWSSTCSTSRFVNFLILKDFGWMPNELRHPV
jgi:ribosome silencing factor RsfS/YbeB/iojap